LLKAEQRAHPSLPVGLAWAKLAVSEGQSADVSAALGFAAQLKEIRPADWPLLREMAGLLAAHAVRPAALQVYKNLARAKPPTTETLKALLAEARQTADAAGDLKQSLEFARQINELTPAVPGK